MKLSLLAAIVAAASISMSCKEVINTVSNIGGEKVIASGPSVKQEREVSEVSSVDVSSGISFRYVQSNTLKLTVEAPENIQPCIATEIKDGELTVKTIKSFRSNDAQVLVTLMAPTVTDFDVSSGASVSIADNYQVAQASVDIDVSSGASFSAGSLIASEAEVEVSSGASASIEGISVAGFAASVSSGASLSLSGQAVSAKLKASSGASISASSLKAQSGSASANSGGSILSNILNPTVSTGGGGTVNNNN